jgi:hypothetical protein
MIKRQICADGYTQFRASDQIPCATKGKSAYAMPALSQVIVPCVVSAYRGSLRVMMIDQPRTPKDVILKQTDFIAKLQAREEVIRFQEIHRGFKQVGV